MSRLVCCASFALVAVTLAPPARADKTPAQCISSLESAISMRKSARYRDARAQLAECASQACPAEIRSECVKQMEAVNAAIPSVLFEAKDSQGADVGGVEVSVDGKPLGNGARATAVEFDPGEHEFTFTAPGKAPVMRLLVLRQGEKSRRETVVFAHAAAPGVTPVVEPAPSPAEPTAPVAVAATGTAPAPSGNAFVWNGSKIASVALGSVGVIGLGLGAVFGAQAISYAKTSKTDCASSGNCANHAGAVTANSNANSSATLSDVMIVSGAALVAAGAVVWIAGPKGESGAPGVSIAPAVAPGLLGLRLEGSF